jgi:hypothetical protein
MRRIPRLSWLALALPASSLAADAQAQGQAIPRTNAAAIQRRESCVAGNVFGIVAYQCANCGMSSPRDSTRIVYSFGTEPVVLETDNPTNRIKPGDFVVAVNGNPITTRAGADQFAYPPAGESVITVRRNGVNINVEQLVTTERSCSAGGFFLRIPADTAGVGRGGGFTAPATGGGARVGRAGGGGGGRGGRGGAVARAPDSLNRALLDSARARLAAGADSVRTNAGLRAMEPVMMRSTTTEAATTSIEVRNFALTLTCTPACSRARARDGTMYWRFEGYPAVANPSPTGLAGRAGLRHGDVLISVNDLSPLTEEGALLLNRAERELSLRLEISRAGKRERITLKL